MFLPAPAFADPEAAFAVRPVVSVYREPARSSEQVTQILYADRVDILDRKRGWARVRVPSQRNYEGWVRESLLVGAGIVDSRHLDESTPRRTMSQARVQAVLPRGRVTLYAGTTLPVASEDARNAKLVFLDGREVTVPRAALSVPGSGGAGLGAVAFAKSLKRTRYQWGGMTNRGIDCSGLTFLAYRIQGIAIERDSKPQSEMGGDVPKESIEAGDLVFFALDKPGVVSHVGLYAGDGRFVHASKSGGVRENRMDEAYFRDRFVKAVRVSSSTPTPPLPPDAGRRGRLFPATDEEIARIQKDIAGRPVGERIAFWAERFAGLPYDTDPLGAYVRESRIVVDNRVDCMYHTFRSAELALSSTPLAAAEKALALRFRTKGRLDGERVANYDERFEYGEDMIDSGKWGREITKELGPVAAVPGTRGRSKVEYLGRESLTRAAGTGSLKSGDILFWIKDPKKRIVGEIVGHIGIVMREDEKAYMIHAGGVKANGKNAGGGEVKKVLLSGYLSGTAFLGARVARFEEDTVNRE
ncbi:MAG: C40 family peptidase [Nitrospirae bacterium]|nr:C40 family peptidase [Nitrospirota bacterium]